MQSTATTPQEYIDALPADRKSAVRELRRVVLQNLPNGFEEAMSYGMISYVVPYAIYPTGYHADPQQPLPFISIASQRNYVALYHMGIHPDPELLEWFTKAHPMHSAAKLDMGKSCIRFKNMDAIPYKLIGELASKRSPQQWIDLYETNLKKKV